MPGGGSRRGRRDNGLVAAEYAAVGDVDPRVGEHLLDVLAGDGIAAYLLPATDLHPVTRTTTLPAVPTDRLYADREHLATASDYLARLLADDAGADERVAAKGGADRGGAGARGDAGATDLDAAWAGIIAGYDAKVDDTAAHWPAAENVPDRAPDDTDPDLGHQLGLDRGGPDNAADRPVPTAERPTTTARPPDEPSLLDALDTFGADVPDPDDDGYTPPPPPPVPRPPAPVIASLLGIVSGLLAFFSPTLVPIDTDVTQMLGFALLLGGVVGLIWRLRPGDEPDDEPDDDGAVV
ncbi:MAG: hypothetical protein QOI74_862 [Micromonosporaceae bacterium]|nr:hypothetical protein [Micromonosporaceae bacterium]